MQLTFIGTGHPAAIVLMNLSASNFFSLHECFSFACVDPFAMGLGWLWHCWGNHQSNHDCCVRVDEAAEPSLLRDRHGAQSDC